MMKRLALPSLPLAAVLAAGCAGSVPKLRGIPEQGMAAVIVGGRFLLPTGETSGGSLYLNLEGEGGRRAEVYRLPIRPRQTLLYQVEPGLYRLGPTRNFLGFYQPILKARVEDQIFRIPFPRDILRQSAFDLKPKGIVAIGVFEVRVEPALPGRRPTLKVRLDDSLDARRGIVQNVVREMMDPKVPAKNRESAIAWARALQNALMNLVSETERAPLFKAGP
ncbi:MAG: hypothetical protein PHF00_03240 [Elusimicrobia bacterium]|nr:hypothetical protein [Elusimicrobiota bacterium]